MKKSNKEFAIELSKRTRKLAFNIIKLSSSLKKEIEANVIRYQITKSGCSIGANYREANCSRSKADFRSRIKICHSESNETVFWLEVIEDQSWVNPQLIDELKKEVNSLGAIFATIDRNLN
jgi:four helix bundle protein